MIVMLLVLLGIGYLPAAETFAAWKYHGQIQAQETRFVAVPLSPHNLDLCDKPDLSDLRVTDARGVEVPYAVVFETELRSQTEQAGMEINREYPDPSTSRLTVDFGSSVMKNRITVATDGNSFRRHLRVEGSDDLRTWATLLPEGWVMAAGVTPDRRFESADIGANTYRYLRVSVSRMIDESEPPRILKVSCRHELVRNATESAVPGRLISYSTGQGTSTAEIDFGTRNLPIQHLRLLLRRDPARIFEKRCEVAGRNSLQHTERVRFESDEYGKERTVVTPWETLGSAVVFRNSQGGESLDLRVRAGYRYVRISIDNGDSPPLEVSGVTGYAVPAYLVFEPAGQSRFDLFSGNPDAPAPRYDSAKVLASLDTRNLPRGNAGDLMAQPGTRAPAQPEGQRLVWFVLAVVVLFTLWILWNTARTIRKEQAAGPEKSGHTSGTTP